MMQRGISVSMLVRLISTALIIFAIFLASSGCSSKREIDKRRSNEGQDAQGEDNPQDGGDDFTDGTDKYGDEKDIDKKDGQPDDTVLRDAGYDAERRDGDDTGGVGGSGNPIDVRDGGRPDSSDPGTDSGDSTRPPVITVPYENLQELPNTSARACSVNALSSVPAGLFPSCEDVCPNASCVANSMLSFANAPAGMENLFYPCQTDSSCIPNHLIGTLGAIQNKKCRSVGNMEGACISVCNTNTASTLSAENLPQDSCYETEVCVPCYDPIKGGLTAFNPCGNYMASSCNPGATESAMVFDKCCDGNGTCIPGLADINPDISQLLGKDSCQGEDDLCLPRMFGMANYRPARCETNEGDEGRCLSKCISPSFPQQLSTQDCATTELCVPCSVNGISTGACTINDDEPGTDGDI